MSDWTDDKPVGNAATNFDTPLSSTDEARFQAWKQKYAPRDSGQDYDLRGAYLSGVKPDATTGHWPDTYKKPNHPTFSDQSQYAASGKPGRWEGDKFIPPAADWNQDAPALKPSTDLANPSPAPRAGELDAAGLLAATNANPGQNFVRQLAEPVGEALTHYGSKMAQGVAGLAGGGAGVLASLPGDAGDVAAGAPQDEFTKPRDMAAAASGAVPSYTPQTAAGKALTTVGDWALGQAGKGIQWLGKKAADVTGSPLAGALTEGAASVLAPGGSLKLAQMPFKRGMGAADAALQAKLDAGPPLRVDPTLDVSKASVEQPPPRAAGDLGVDMNGRSDPGINLNAAPNNLGNPLGAPSAAAQVPLPDTRPSLSALDRLIASATEKTLAQAKGKELTVKDTSYAELIKQGYVFPPSHANPSFVGNRLESIAGKAALDQQATILNQAVTDRLAGKAASIPDGTPITMQSLKDARYVLEEPYRTVANLSPTAKTALEDLKQARSDAGDSWRHYNRSADPSSKTKAKQYDEDAATLESMIDEEATRLGQPGLLQELRDARKASAQNRDIERAFNPATGEVDARVLGRMWAKDKGQKMTGEAAVIARYANTAKKLARPAADVPTPGVGKTEAAASAALGLTGHATGLGWWPAGLALAGGPMRALLLSRYMQKGKTAPNLSQPGFVVNLAEFAKDADPLMFGAAGAAAQENFDMNNPLGFK